MSGCYRVANIYGQGDGLLSNFFSKTIVGKALGGVAKTVVSSVPGGKQLIAAGSAVQNIFKGAQTAAKAVVKAPVGVKVAAGAGVVGVGTAGIMVAGGGGGQPALPSAGGAMGALSTGSTTSMLPDSIDLSLCRSYLKAPHNYVIIHDPATGQPIMACRRDFAIRNRIWHPARKPPISAGDWHKYQTAIHVEKKLAKIARRALAKHHHQGGQGRADKFKLYRKVA